MNQEQRRARLRTLGVRQETRHAVLFRAEGFFDDSHQAFLAE
jgi:hypothetical protein